MEGIMFDIDLLQSLTPEQRQIVFRVDPRLNFSHDAHAAMKELNEANVPPQIVRQLFLCWAQHAEHAISHSPDPNLINLHQLKMIAFSYYRLYDKLCDGSRYATDFAIKQGHIFYFKDLPPLSWHDTLRAATHASNKFEFISALSHYKQVRAEIVRQETELTSSSKHIRTMRNRIRAQVAKTIDRMIERNLFGDLHVFMKEIPDCIPDRARHHVVRVFIHRLPNHPFNDLSDWKDLLSTQLKCALMNQIARRGDLNVLETASETLEVPIKDRHLRMILGYSLNTNDQNCHVHVQLHIARTLRARNAKRYERLYQHITRETMSYCLRSGCYLKALDLSNELGTPLTPEQLFTLLTEEFKERVTFDLHSIVNELSRQIDEKTQLTHT